MERDVQDVGVDRGKDSKNMRMNDMTMTMMIADIFHGVHTY